MQCQRCGNPISPGARFCATCGAPATAEARQTALLRPGQTMNNGQYLVQRALGKGGMGAVYLAENTQAFHRLCVIKEMLAYYQPGEEARAQARFEEEARTLANLKHPGIPDMYGYFTERGRNYIVMEYIQGDDFEKLVERSTLPSGGLPEDDVVRYGIELCRVLEYLARVEPVPVVHCDIKPSNIILDKNSQQAVLVDFGTARGKTPQATASPTAERPSVYGTVGYAAPELFAGQAVPRSDVFALANTLYYLLTADDPRDHPFQWPKMQAVSAPLRLILEHAMAEQLDQRLDAEELRQQLDAYRAAKAGTIRPLTFPGGNQATTVTGVLDLALRYWEYTREILYDGSLDAWLRGVAHDPVAAGRAREAVAEHPDAPDLGLDAFVRSLNPRIPAPRLTVSDATPSGGTRTGALGRHTLTLTNHGPGAAHGSIAGSASAVRPQPVSFLLAPGESLQVTVALRAGQRPSTMAQVIVTPQAGVSLVAELRASTTTPPAAGAPKAVTSPPKPQARPKASPAPQSTLRRGPGTGLSIALAVIVLAAAVYLLRVPLFSGAGSVSSGLLALEAGDWAAARRAFARLDPADDQTVARVAAMLDAQQIDVPGGGWRVSSEEGSSGEPPAHTEIAAFRMDRTEVTNAQYQRFVTESGHPAPTHWSNARFPRGQALQPVTSVTWRDASAYAAWLGKRLPTEAEWEWAARGAEGRLYPWGDDTPSSGDPRANTRESGPGRAVDVGGYPNGATPTGILDLAGNVSEWTADAYESSSSVEVAILATTRMSVRGSAWDSYENAASARGWRPASERATDLGFRCVSDY